MSLHVIQRPNDLGNKKALNVAECIMWSYAQFRVLGVINIPQNGIKGNLRLEISGETHARKKHINIHHSLRNPCGLSWTIFSSWRHIIILHKFVNIFQNMAIMISGNKFHEFSNKNGQYLVYNRSHLKNLKSN